jgi:RHS repeat-associated protein
MSTVPRTRAPTARLEIKDTDGVSKASAQGPSPLSVSATGLAPDKYFAVLTPLSGAGSGTLTGAYPGRVPKEILTYDGNDHATSIDDGTATVTETLGPSGRVLRRRVVDDITFDVLEDTSFGYDSDSDSPAYAIAGSATTTYVSGPPGLIAIVLSGTASYPIANGHGDLVGVTNASGSFTAYPETDEFGVGTPPAGRLGWLGGHERFATGGTLNLIRMGVRLYDPALGRFLEVDPVEGGSANDYDYAAQDPVNGFDLGGTMTMKGDYIPAGLWVAAPIDWSRVLAILGRGLSLGSVAAIGAAIRRITGGRAPAGLRPTPMAGPRPLPNPGPQELREILRRRMTAYDGQVIAAAGTWCRTHKKTCRSIIAALLSSAIGGAVLGCRKNECI